MAKFREYDIEAMEEVYDLGKALASPVRLEMLQLLYDKSLIIGEIAKEMNLPASSAAFHAKILEKAGLIRMEEQPVPEELPNCVHVKWIICMLDLYEKKQL